MFDGPFQWQDRNTTLRLMKEHVWRKDFDVHSIHHRSRSKLRVVESKTLCTESSDIDIVFKQE